MKSTELLEAEHYVIQKVAEACGVLAEEMKNGANLPLGVLQSLVAFLGMYAGQYHHEKEKWLVSMLRVKGVSSGSWPIITLDHENLKLASLVNDLAIAVDEYSKGVGVRQVPLKRFCTLLPKSIPITSGKKIMYCSRWQISSFQKRTSRCWATPCERLT